MPFFVRHEEFHEKIKKEYHTYPKLETYESWFKIESFVMESVDRYSDHKKYGQHQNKNMQHSVYSLSPEVG